MRVDIGTTGDYVMTDQASWAEENGGELREIYRDGKLITETTLGEIRRKLNG